DAAATTIIAIEHALMYKVPTVLAIPYDVAQRDVGSVPEPPELQLPPPLRPTPGFGDAAVADLARVLAGAKRPLLLAGRGAWLAGAGEALGDLAEMTGALTASTALGRSIFPRPEYDLGVTGGFGASGAMGPIREADVAVVFGASLNQFTMRFGELFAPGTTVVQIDTRQAASHPHVSGFIRGDAKVVAELLTGELAAAEARPSGWRERVDVDRARQYDAGEGVCADGRLDPRSAAARLAELLRSEEHTSELQSR